MRDNESIKIGIIGLGLIGGSLAKKLASEGYTIVGIAHSDSTYNKALELNIFEKVSKNIEDLNGCNIIFVATPINTINITFMKLANTISLPCIVTDVASIKGEIVDLAEKTFNKELITFIAGHPMAGTEYKGIDASFDELYSGCRWVLCPTDMTKKNQIELLSSVIQSTGASIVYSNPYMHDLAVAMISHVPLLMSLGLVELIESRDDIVLKELSYYLAASGFRDTTRLAGGNPELSYDMLKYNEKNVLKALEILNDSVSNLINLLKADKEGCMEKLNLLSEVRRQMYSAEGKNIFKGLSG